MRDAERFPVPAEYQTYLICERFGRFPSEVEAQPLADMEMLLICMSVEAEVRQAHVR